MCCPLEATARPPATPSSYCAKTNRKREPHAVHFYRFDRLDIALEAGIGLTCVHFGHTELFPLVRVCSDNSQLVLYTNVDLMEKLRRTLFLPAHVQHSVIVDVVVSQRSHVRELFVVLLQETKRETSETHTENGQLVVRIPAVGSARAGSAGA